MTVMVTQRLRSSKIGNTKGNTNACPNAMVVKLVLDPEGDEYACHPSHPPPRDAVTADPTRLLLRHACRRQVPPWPLYDPRAESSDNIY